MKVGLRLLSQMHFNIHFLVKKLWNVQYFYDSLSESMYFTAKQTKSSKEDVFIPVHTSQELSFNILHRYLHLSNKHDSKYTSEELFFDSF